MEAGKGDTNMHCSLNQGNETHKQLSSLVNAVVGQSAKVLSTSVESLHHDFEEAYQGPAKQHLESARTFLEFSCFKALAQLTHHEDYLHRADFRHFTFDFMVAWEAPFASESDIKDEFEKGEEKDEADEDILFFSDLMPLLVEVENTVGVEAFVRIASCISLVADAISVYPQFETLTASTSGRLPFPVYDKYIEALKMSLRNITQRNERSFLHGLRMLKEEHVMEIDGTSQIVVRHIGSKSSSGRLTLTDHSLYFEPSSILSHRNAIKYDLSAETDHTVSTELSGPWRSRIFDKAISYRTSCPERHIVFEFPELFGSRRRDYWIALLQEVIDAHKIIRKYHLEGICKVEALARSVLGIVRLQATRECMQLVILNPGALLTFTLAENALRGGDRVLEALTNTLKDGIVEITNGDMELNASCLAQKCSIQVLESLKVWKTEQSCKPVFYRVRYGEPTLLEVAVKEARESTGFLQKAKEKEEKVKFDGIGTNITLLKELLRPAMTVIIWIRDLVSWNQPLHSMIVFIFTSILILRDWSGYMVPILFATAGVLIIWLRISGRAENCREIVFQTPSGRISLDQVITAQWAVTQIEELLQTLNIILLKILAIIMSVEPEAATLVPVVLIGIGMVLAVVPVKVVVFASNVGLFTFSFWDKLKEYKLVRRLRELWHSVPPLPARMVESKDDEEDHNCWLPTIR